ncbi:Trehalose 6-phosphate phosphorylase [Streptomyces hygroscopicus subsp. limoneus]|nr:Trehalose 6-phosphate phosphorylase [Streptomyces hygroscopicus subsp. limoneus]
MSEWTWEYEGYDSGTERLRESLCTLGNGYFATRGAVPECRAGPVHYPGTCAAGCYNFLESTVAGRQVENEELVNLPNWLVLRFRCRSSDGPWGQWFSPDASTFIDYRHTLELRCSTLTRTIRYRDGAAGVLSVEQVRLVHMGEPHLAALRTVFTAEDWSGEIDVESALDGGVINSNVQRYRSLNRRHLAHVRTGTQEPDMVWLHCRTSTSDIAIAMAARTVVTGQPAVSSAVRSTPHRAVHHLVIPIAPGRPVAVEKTVALYTSRDRAIGNPLVAAVDQVSAAPDFSTLLNSHVAAWEQLWRRAEIRVPGQAGRVLRLHLFHVLQTLSPHTADLDVGVPARGLHGEAHRGHVFWDELFVLPYLNLHLPEVSRALLNDRHRRLPQACRAATAVSRAGAMYPWQSGSDGREETQELHLNPRSGRWLPDHSRLQHHVGSAIAYNVWQYCEATGDTEFLHTKGAEMLLQIARLWADIAVLDPETVQLDGDNSPSGRRSPGDCGCRTTKASSASSRATRTSPSWTGMPTARSTTTSGGWTASFSPAELRQLLRRLGYGPDDEVWRKTVDYYLRRTSHGSTLSGLVHGWVLARVKGAEAWRYVQEALEADIADIQGGTTGEGIHLGAMAGTLDLVQRGLTGPETREDALWLDPAPLPALSEYGLSLRYRGHWASAYDCGADNCASACPTRRNHRSA